MLVLILVLLDSIGHYLEQFLSVNDGSLVRHGTCVVLDYVQGPTLRIVHSANIVVYQQVECRFVNLDLFEDLGWSMGSIIVITLPAVV